MDQTDRLLIALNELNECRGRLAAIRSLAPKDRSAITAALRDAEAEMRDCQDKILDQARGDSEFAERLHAIVRYSPDRDFRRLAARLARA